MMQNKYSKLTEILINSFLSRDAKMLEKLLHPKIIWIHSDGHQYTGIQSVLQHLSNESSTFQHAEQFLWERGICDERFILLSGGTFLVNIGEDRIQTSYLYNVTAVWKKVTESFQLLHLHFSFSHYYTFSSFGHTIAVKLEEGSLQIISEPQIIYMEAFGKYTEIHCISRNFRTACFLSSLEEKVSEDFLRIHRSYLVNLNYVTNIRRCFITVADEIQLPIPGDKYSYVKKIILDFIMCRK